MFEQINFLRGGYGELWSQISNAVKDRRRLAVYFCNAHMTTEMLQSRGMEAALIQADIVCADGISVSSVLKLLGFQGVERLRGPDAFVALLRSAEESGHTVGFFGGSSETAILLRNQLEYRFPKLKISFVIAPPIGTYRQLAEIFQNASLPSANLIFVGLGCPKQELFISELRGVSVPILAVGAAFDFFSGSKVEAPQFLQKLGMEWLYRLCSEPRRLWKRYLIGNIRFLFFAVSEIVRRNVVNR